MGIIQRQYTRIVNTDPQRRCYNGCHYSSELVTTEWEDFEFNIPADKEESRLKFWRELNDYAVSQRGESARVKYRYITVN
jgi:hypothetical protein